jgi:alpha-1,2-mannosyltransferase
MTQPQPHWLKAEYLKIAAAILIVAYPVTFVGWGIMSPDLVSMSGLPFGSDFITFWAASHLALAGEPAAAFDMARIVAAEKLAVPANDGIFLWHYPPSFQLFVLPLSLLPYLAAYSLWVLTTLAALALVVRRAAPSPYMLPLLVTFTGTYFNFFHGQNGFLTAALFGGGLLLLRERPILAGVLLGLMSYKPQFGLLLPVALIAGRQWTAFIAAACSTLALAATSWAVLGGEVWIAFWKNLPFVQGILADGRLPWPKIPSVFVALRTLGLDQTGAYTGQGMVAVFVAITIAWIWKLQAGSRVAIAALMAGAPLMSPYVFDYDLALLAVPIALLAWDGVARGWHKGEREVLVLAFFTPALVSSIGYAITLQLGPLFIGALFAIAVRRALRAPAHLVIAPAA